MKRINLVSLSLLFALAGLFTSCEKDDDNVVPVEAVTITIDASDYTKWQYFSFEEGKIVGESAVEGNHSGLDWDIAFHRYDFRLNGGKSGDGMAGALVSTGNVGAIGWEDLVVAPESGYAVDDSISVLPSPAMPPTYVTVAGSKTITGGMTSENPTAIVFDMTTRSYSYTDQIFVVKTADGKYAKIWITDFKNSEGNSGHITMKYAYQADGSTKLD